MDRQVVYPGEVLSDTILLTGWRSIMEALGYLVQGTFGTSTAAIGLACTPTSPASLTVNVAPGAITELTVVDNLSYGSLGTDTTDPLVKMGINVSTQQFTVTAPSGGNNQYYLISAQFSEQNAGSEVLPYYNSANPQQPYSGPGNDGASQYTAITQTVNLTLTAGAASSGTPAIPATPAGQTALWLIYVASGATSVTSGNITQAPSAPFPPYALQNLTPGTKNLKAVTPATQGNWTVPNEVTLVKLTMWAGGGAGGSGLGGAGGGGAGGGFLTGYYPVTPGQQYFVTVGNGGVGAGTPGGSSSFASLASVTGGGAGANGSSGAGGAGSTSGGAGTLGSPAAGGYTITGGNGGNGFVVSGMQVGGAGGSSGQGGAGIANPGTGNANGVNSTSLGQGGTGGIGSGIGAQGGPGLVIIEW